LVSWSEAAFRDAVGHLVRDRDHGVDRAHVDHPHPAARRAGPPDHTPRRRLADEEGALRLTRSTPVEVGFREVEEIGRVHDAGIG